jgi:hypothetical protein
MIFTVLTGTISFSLALYNFQQLGLATSNVAQQIGALSGLLTDPCAKVVTSVTTVLPNWTASKFTYTVTLTDSSGTAHQFGPTTGSSFSCTAGAADMADNQPVTLLVGYQYTWFPILSFSPSGNLAASQTVIGQ